MAKGEPEIPLDAAGRKWRADSSTLAGIRRMQSRVDTFAQGSDVAELQRALQEDFDLLLRQCTMQGEAHDRLHQYLLPLRDRIGALKEGARDGAVPELKQYLAKYWDYFSA